MRLLKLCGERGKSPGLVGVNNPGSDELGLGDKVSHVRLGEVEVGSSFGITGRCFREFFCGEE